MSLFSQGYQGMWLQVQFPPPPPIYFASLHARARLEPLFSGAFGFSAYHPLRQAASRIAPLSVKSVRLYVRSHPDAPAGVSMLLKHPAVTHLYIVQSASCSSGAYAF